MFYYSWNINWFVNFWISDCGSGIGRVTKNLLIRHFNEVCYIYLVCIYFRLVFFTDYKKVILMFNNYGWRCWKSYLKWFSLKDNQNNFFIECIKINCCLFWVVGTGVTAIILVESLSSIYLLRIRNAKNICLLLEFVYNEVWEIERERELTDSVCWAVCNWQTLNLVWLINRS